MVCNVNEGNLLNCWDDVSLESFKQTKIISLALDTYMKLHHLLQKCSFFLIKLAAVQASGCARMKLRIRFRLAGTANRRISKGGFAALNLFLGLVLTSAMAYS